MKSYKLFSTIFLLSFFLLISCSSDDGNPTEPSGGDNQGTTNLSGQPLPGVATSADGVLATINYEFQAIPGFPAVALTMGFAQFGGGVDAGTVMVNSNSLGKTSQGGTTFYISPSPTNPTESLNGISFNGSNHSWQVSGAGDVPQFSGSVVSPSSFTLSAPANNAAVSKANGVNISWNNTNGNTKVLIVLVSVSNSGQYYSTEVNDNGSFTIPSSEISSFSGECLLQVVKYNYNSANAGGKTYYMISEIVKSVTITLN